MEYYSYVITQVFVYVPAQVSTEVWALLESLTTKHCSSLGYIIEEVVVEDTEQDSELGHAGDSDEVVVLL